MSHWTFLLGLVTGLALLCRVPAQNLPPDALPPDALPSALPPEVLQLARVRNRMSEILTRLPNYTCLQTIERMRRRAPARKLELVDMVRLEVALVNGNELFSWPGAGYFEDTEISDMVQGGAIGNGNFALHARSVFMSASPSFTYIGEQDWKGRPALRWDYSVPLNLSGYTLKMGPVEARTAYRGSFWVDADSLDLIRLEVHGVNIPAQLLLK
ncbi:MAG: hypothetical protein ACRD7E_18465, partial [Bryobacteraceae bacterium]